MDVAHLTEQKIIAYLKEEFLLVDDLSSHSPLFSNGELDSVAMMSLIAFVEQETGTEIRAQDVTLDNFDTPARIASFAQSRME